MKQLLLIEPDRTLAEIYVDTLARAGYQVVPCASAQAALFAADELRPDAVILELQLIEHSGIEFLLELRSYLDWQNIPVIIHSIVPPAEFNAHRDILQNQLGIDSYLYKPTTTLKNLIDQVERVLGVAA